MTVRSTTFGKRVTRFADFACRPCTVGIKMTMNEKVRSHIRPNNGTGKPSWKVRLLINSRITNGSTKTKLMSACVMRFRAVPDTVCVFMMPTIYSLLSRFSSVPASLNLLKSRFRAAPLPTFEFSHLSDPCQATGLPHGKRQAAPIGNWQSISSKTMPKGAIEEYVSPTRWPSTVFRAELYWNNDGPSSRFSSSPT